MTLKRIILASLFVGAVVSCVKAPENEDVNNTPEEVGNALAESWGETSPLSMTVNDFISQDTTQKVDTNPTAFFTLREGITISKKDELSDRWLYTYLYQFNTIRGDSETPLSTKEDTRTVGKPTPPTATTTGKAAELTVADNIRSIQQKDLKPMADDYHMSLGFEKVFGLAYACEKTENTDKYCKETLELDSCEIQCANLKVQEVMRPVPDQVKAQPNCGGFANCMWRTKMVSFDWILTLKKGGTSETQRVNYLVSLAEDLPFFARMTDYCYRQLITISIPDDPGNAMNGRKVLVNTCTTLQNYRPAP
jgi:hypothetical protein